MSTATFSFVRKKGNNAFAVLCTFRQRDRRQRWLPTQALAFFVYETQAIALRCLRLNGNRALDKDRADEQRGQFIVQLDT